MGEIADYHVEMFSSGRWAVGGSGNRWKECNNCGRRKLYWMNVNEPEESEKWVLYESETYAPHKCPTGTVANGWKNRNEKEA